VERLPWGASRSATLTMLRSGERFGLLRRRLEIVTRHIPGSKT
jgi:hypothetical protein